MKTVLYILALLVTAVAAYFTSANIQPHQDQLDKTNEVEGKLSRLELEIRSKGKEVKAMIELKKEQQTILNETEGDIGVKESNKKNLVKESASYDSELAQLAEQKEQKDQVIAKIKAIFEKEDIPIEEVASYFEQMQDDKKQLNKSHVSLLAEKERFTGDVKSKKKEIASLLKAASERRTNLKSNGVSSLITAVDNDWGFVVVKPHTNSLIKQDSQLIVIRGSQHVGRLTINAIEKGRVLANIDYNSMVSGMRIRAGDRVILGKVVTR